MPIEVILVGKIHLVKRLKSWATILHRWPQDDKVGLNGLIADLDSRRGLGMNEASDEGHIARLSELLNVVMELAAGNFSARAVVSHKGDELDALIAGINMLAEEINAKFSENSRLMETLERNMATMAAQHRTIMSLSTPSLQVWHGIVVLPLIGMLDAGRAQNLSNDLLERIVSHGAEVVIVDVTGIAAVDTTTAKHLLDTFAAVRLLGARCILTGLSAANARSMVDLDLDMQTVTVCGSLHDGLKRAFGMTGKRVYEPA